MITSRSRAACAYSQNTDVGAKMPLSNFVSAIVCENLGILDYQVMKLCVGVCTSKVK